MIIYLDQNKWIELGRIFHKKDTCPESQALLSEIVTAVEKKEIVLPLSAMHYMETARISNSGRRSRLGKVMFNLSQGNTLTAFTKIVFYELESYLSNNFKDISPEPLKLIGKGIAHAFGQAFPDKLPAFLQNEFERVVLTGESILGDSPPKFHCHTQRENFKNHLSSLHIKKKQLPEKKWHDMLAAIVLADIVEPLNEVIEKHSIPKDEFLKFLEKNPHEIIESMPSRKLDLHLHKQVLRNPNYEPKLSDLEDWAGLGVASQYCDVVVCEKHLADMMRRDGFKTKARVETKLSKALKA